MIGCSCKSLGRGRDALVRTSRRFLGRDIATVMFWKGLTERRVVLKICLRVLRCRPLGWCSQCRYKASLFSSLVWDRCWLESKEEAAREKIGDNCSMVCPLL
jgi:hypothetical protein